MKNILLFLIIPFLTAATCNKSRQTIPVCIQQKIDEIKAQSRWNPPAQVNEYTYRKQRVYLFSSDCCDQYNMLYDENCNAVCAPSGGFAGKGDEKCADFDETAKYVRLVWKDER
jgi:hypothetical protein